MEKEYLLREKPLKALWLFALPMMVGNLFQQFYTMADSMIVGRFVGEDALAAIGASYALTNVFICIAIGGGVGAGVLTGRYFGAREYLRLRLCIRTALMTFLVLSLLLSAFGLLFCSAILRALHTPGNVLPMASAYLMIYFLGLPFLFLYNMLSAMFNALGRSRVPLYLLIFSSALNIGLDLCLVCGLELGIEGAAWATLAAQTVSAVLSFLLFRRTLNQCTAPEPLTDSCDKSIAESPLRQSPDSEIPVHPMSDGIEHHSALSITLFSLTELAAITRITLPSIFQQATVSIGAMLVQAVINPFGSQVLAGYAAASRLESFCIVPMSALGQAMSAYTSQNLGAAGKAIVSTEPLSQAHDTAQKNLSFPEADAETSLHYIKRVRQGYRAALALAGGFAVLLCIFLLLSARPLIASFLGPGGTNLALETGVQYLHFINFFFALIGLKMCTDGVLRGAADMGIFTLANLANLTFRVLFAALLAPRFGAAFVWYAIPLGWLLNSLISGYEYRSGRWLPPPFNKHNWS